jgi:hypothetical protein
MAFHSPIAIDTVPQIEHGQPVGANGIRPAPTISDTAHFALHWAFAERPYLLHSIARCVHGRLS